MRQPGQHGPGRARARIRARPGCSLADVSHLPALRNGPSTKPIRRGRLRRGDGKKTRWRIPYQFDTLLGCEVIALITGPPSADRRLPKSTHICRYPAVYGRWSAVRSQIEVTSVSPYFSSISYEAWLGHSSNQAFFVAKILLQKQGVSS